MAIEFYSVKHRRKVQVDESEVQKKTFERQTSKGTVRQATRRGWLSHLLDAVNPF